MLALDFVGQREKSECHKTGDCNAVVMQWQCAKCIFDTNDFSQAVSFPLNWTPLLWSTMILGL